MDGDGEKKLKKEAPLRWLNMDAIAHYLNNEMVINTNEMLPAPAHASATNTRESESRGGSDVEADDAIDNVLLATTTTYEDVFGDFDDLYLPIAAWDRPSYVRKRRLQQQRHAAKVLQQFCQDIQTGQQFLDAKRAEFLRVIFQRATNVLKLSPQNDEQPASQSTAEAIAYDFTSASTEWPSDTTTPELHPRKWPHIPFRDPQEWEDDVSNVLEFARRVSELPEGSLIYDPFDVDAFVSRACDVLRKHGIVTAGQSQLVEPSTAKGTTFGLAVVCALFTVAIRLQSFSLLVLVSDILLRWEATTSVLDDGEEDIRGLIHQNLEVLRAAVDCPVPPMPLPRALLSRWKLQRYQPITTDALATDGVFLYIYGRIGLMKVGTGRGGTLRDFVYAHNKRYRRSRSAERSWLCLIGRYLFCRSLIMPSHRVDRIAVEDLNSVEELVLSGPPNAREPANGAKSVFAMVSDGSDLFTVTCVDTLARATKKKSRPSKSSKASSKSTDSSSTIASGASAIRVGDRVVRGPDWKWSNQDGEEGALGTVERISSWGGAKGCGITVRWDKNQRVNTYRWGAEGCYDIIIVLERADGTIVKQALPVKPSGTKGGVDDVPEPPRYQFIVTRYDISRFVKLVDLDQDSMNAMLGIVTKQEPQATEEPQSLRSSVHEHTVAVSSSKTTWMCDGSTAGCLGNNSDVRYRCEEGCDYDLCEVCLENTLVEAEPQASSKKEGGEDTADSSTPLAPELTPAELEAKQIDDLYEVWGGYYSRTECTIALRRVGHSLEDASSWLQTSGESLRREVIISWADSVLLENPPGKSALDPVLLVAGSFYAIDGTICIVSPPGLYEGDKARRPIHSSDIAWLFDTTTGKLVQPHRLPVNLRGIAAGAPLCVDVQRSRVIVYSGFLNCVEEFHVAQSLGPARITSPNSDLQDLGRELWSLLAQASAQRWALPAYKPASVGLRELITQTELSIAAAVQAAARSGKKAKTSASAVSTKAESRLVKRLRARLEVLEGCNQSTKGYIIPYVTDFRSFGLQALLQALHRVVTGLTRGEACDGDVETLLSLLLVWRSVVKDCCSAGVKLEAGDNWKLMLAAINDFLVQASQGTLLLWNESSASVQTQVVREAQRLLCSEMEPLFSQGVNRNDMLTSGLKWLVSEERLPANYFAIMEASNDESIFRSAADCRISLVKTLLLSSVERGFVATHWTGPESQRNDLIGLIKATFQLSTREFLECEGPGGGGLHHYSPVEKLLLCLFNLSAVNSSVSEKVDAAVDEPTLFDSFSTECFQMCRSLIEKAVAGGKRTSLAHSACGKLLPLVLPMLRNCGVDSIKRVRESMIALATSAAPLVQDVELDKSELLANCEVVESRHPYSKRQSALRRVVRIPGATSLRIHFDPRCSTCGDADYVVVIPGHSTSQTERVPFGEGSIGEAGGCFFGTRHSGNWPRARQSVTLWGDTVTIILSVSSQERESAVEDEDMKRWGLKCVVQGVFLAPAQSWAVELASSVSNTLGVLYQRELIEQQAVIATKWNKAIAPMLTHLRARPVQIHAQFMEIINHLTQSSPTAPLSQDLEPLVAAVLQAVRQRGGSRRDSGETWNQAMRSVIAAVIAASVDVDQAPQLQVGSQPWQSIIRDVATVERWMMARVQLLKEWEAMKADKLSIDELTDRLDASPERLSALCELKAIAFNSAEVPQGIAKLHTALGIEPREPSVSAYDEVSGEILKKADLVLSRLQASSLTSVPCLDDIDVPVPTVVEFFRSTCKATDILDAESCLSRASTAIVDAYTSYQDAIVEIESVTSRHTETMAGGVGACWLDATSPLHLRDPRVTSPGWKQQSIEQQKGADQPRIASIIDGFAAFEAFRDGADPKQLFAALSALTRSVIRPKTGDDGRHEIAWICYRYAIELAVASGQSDQVAAMLRETIEVQESPMDPSSLAQLLKITSSISRTVVASPVSRREWVDTCCSILFAETPYPEPVQLRCIRILRACFKNIGTSDSGLSTYRADLLERAVRRVGQLRASVVSEEGGATRDCCLVVFNNEKARSKMIQALETVGASASEIPSLPANLSSIDGSENQKPATTQDPEEIASMEHRSVRCDGCDQSPIMGYRFKCHSCSNYDLCTKCYTEGVHDMDHQFVRMTNTSRNGEVLQPRSQSKGEMLLEAPLLGSLPWVAGILQVLVESFGFIVLKQSPRDLCIEHLKVLSDLGFVSTIVECEDAVEMQAVPGWETLAAASLEPGAVRVHRRSSTSSPSSLKKMDRSVVEKLNRSRAQREQGKRLPLASAALVSELIALARLLINEQGDISKLTSAVMDAVPRLVTPSSQAYATESELYLLALGLANVLGGYTEALRVGATVSTTSALSFEQRVGVVKQCTNIGDTLTSLIFSDELDVDPEVVVQASRGVRIIPEVSVETIDQALPVSTSVFPTLAAVLKASHKLLKCDQDELRKDPGMVAATELVVAWLRMYCACMDRLPSLMNIQASAGHGNVALLLFQLAKTTKSSDSVEKLLALRDFTWTMHKSVMLQSEFKIASRPTGKGAGELDEAATYGPGANGQSDPTEYVFNMYSYSSRAELPKHSGRNKLLEHWEKYVIPSIESYVAGSFKSYEMDYFFAQLREPLREGNAAAAMKIAYTLCDGHVPSGCQYPDPDTDWSALQIDDVEVGASYKVIGVPTWPSDVKWTLGHQGVARQITSTGLVLMQLHNPHAAVLEHWWFPVDSLAVVDGKNLPQPSVVNYVDSLASLIHQDLDLMGVIARKCVFLMLKREPDLFPLVSERQSAKNYFNLEDILRMAATAELGCESDVILGATQHQVAAQTDGDRHDLMFALKSVLSKRFEVSPANAAVEDVVVLGQVGGAALVKAHSGKLKTAGDADLKLAHEALIDDVLVAVKYRYKLMEALVQELKRAFDSAAVFLQQNAFMVSSESPPKPTIVLSAPGASCMVVSFAVHPVLMDLPPGSSLEFYRDESCKDRVFGFFGEKRGLNYLPPFVIPGEKCFVRATQAVYARYKFRVDPLTPDFGLALWIVDELYTRITTVPFSGSELESIVASVLNYIADFLVGGVAVLAPCTKGTVCQLLTKMINLAISRSLLNAVPISKLSVLTRDLAVAYDHESSAQKALYSTPLQQLIELLATTDEVSRLKGATSFLYGSVWWPTVVKVGMFTRVLTYKRDGSGVSDPMARIACGRAPIEDVEAVWKGSQSQDLVCERMVLIQKLPRTKQHDELRRALSRFIQHVALEECGDADDQSVLSATEVLRLGILAHVLHLPVDEHGDTVGYAVVDIGRQDIVGKVICRLQKETFQFEGPSTEEDGSLEEMMKALEEKPAGASAADTPAEAAAPISSDSMWPCGVCTLENPLSEIECAACGSPIPAGVLESANRHNTAQAQSNAVGATDSSASISTQAQGWACTACTFINPWDCYDCIACESERDPSLVEPQAPVITTSTATATTDTSSKTPESHSLSGVSMVMLMRIAAKQAVRQVDSFLRQVFTDSEGALAPQLVTIVKNDVKLHDGPAAQSDEVFTLRLARECGFKMAPGGELSVDAYGRLCGCILDAVASTPHRVYAVLRDCGYDLGMERSHFPTVEKAKTAQAKWSPSMDTQLILMARRVGARIGVLSLMELCSSHFCHEHAAEYPLLAELETRDVRLRFEVLKTLNKRILEALPLVDLRNTVDPYSVRARLTAIRHLIFPGVKVRFFTDTQDRANLAQSNLLDVTEKRPVVTLDRRRVASRRAAGQLGPTSFDDPKASLFAATMAQLAETKSSLLRAKRPTGASDPFVSFIAVFAGENVVGEGGPYRQLFNDIAAELLAPENPLFVPTQNSVMKIGEFRDRFLPKPSSTSTESLRMFEFVGVLMGCCVRTGVRLNLRLAPLVWKLMTKQTLAAVDLEHIDWSVCESLKYVEAAAATDGGAELTDYYGESFTTTLSDGTLVELKPGGSSMPVTKANCKEFVRLVRHTRLHECKLQVDAMLRGMGKIVPVHLLQLCTWSELQQWVCGSLAIDIELLKRHTVYSSGMTPDKFSHLEMFWRVLSEFSEDNKRRFINFAWGQDTLPADDAEFTRTHTRLLIKAPPTTEVNQDLLLPKADTCFFNVELPAYSSEAIMREKILLAITLCTSMDGDEQTGRMEFYISGDDMDED